VGRGLVCNLQFIFDLYLTLGHNHYVRVDKEK
jgi:hypothetical protein